jgi:hypothetical protein
VKAKHEWVLLAVLALAAATGYRTLDSRKGQCAQPAGVPAEESSLETVDPAAPPAKEIRPRSLSEGLPQIGQWRGKPVLCDLNGDGDLDLVSSIRRWDRSTPGEGLHVWIGDGAGGWRSSIDGLRRDMSYGGADVADVDGDGRLDIAFSGHDVAPHVFLAREQGTWLTTAEGIDMEYICSDVALGDVTGDGLVDLAVLGFYPKEGGLFLFAGNGRGGFTRTDELMPPAHYGAQVDFQDLDGDGSAEILAVTDRGPLVWRRTEEAKWELMEALAVPEIGGSDLAAATFDFEGDGAQELLVAGMSYEGHPPLRLFRLVEGAWQPYGSLPEGEAFFDAVFARLDPSGPPCIVAAGKFGVNVIAMVAPGEFERRCRIAGTEGVVNVCAGDVNGDGLDEIVCVGFDGVRVLDISSPEGGAQ